MEIKEITIDLETTGLDWTKDKITLIGFKVGDRIIQYDETGILKGKHEQLRQLLADPKITKRGHNVKFDVLFLTNAGFKVCGPYDDTCILAYLENPFRSAHLKDLTESILKRKVTRFDELLEKTRIDKKLPGNRKVPFEAIEIKDLMPYNQADIVNCDDLRKEFNPSEWYIKVEQPLIDLLIQTEARGIQLDIPHLERLKIDYEQKLESINQSLQGVNAKSPKQVREYLQKTGVKLATKTEKGEAKADKLALKKLVWEENNSFAKDLLEYRQYSKLYTTYVKPLLESADSSGRIHGSFNQAGVEKLDGQGYSGTRTGRLTSSSPNLQNIPDRTKAGKDIRRGFIPTSGLIMFDSDLKQIEPRLIAHFSQSRRLINAFSNGLDTHGMFASDIFEKPIDKLTKMERFIGKTSWLATCYGCYYKKLKIIAEVNSDEPIPFDEEYFKKVQSNFWKANPDIANWRTQHIANTRKLGYITTTGGRRISIPNLFSRNPRERNEADRQSINYLIQGSAADIMKLVLVRFKNEFVDKGLGYLLATIHDEVLGEFPEESHVLKMEYIPLINDIMCNTVQLKNVKIEADTKIINNWSEK